jgi:cytochrome c peroxidase
MVRYIGFFGLFLLLVSLNKNEGSISKKEVRITWPKYFPEPKYHFKNNPITPAGFVLGRKLFYDEALSRDYTVSCNTCHQNNAAFAHTDHALSHGIDSKIGNRNVPVIQNLIWKNEFMWDGGVNHIELQPIHPITSKLEMDGNFDQIIVRLRKNQTYITLFRKAFGDTLIDSKRILLALTQFTGSMISCNSRYDSMMLGKIRFNEQEQAGLIAFRNKCAGCHQEPLFTDFSYKNNGLTPDSFLNDIGRAKISLNKEDIYRFQVPTLRNVERTYPYMHDGRYKKLSEVMNHYNRKSHFPGYTDEAVKNMEMLSDKEKVDIVAFLLTLTDGIFISNKKFSDPNFR